MLAKYPGTEEEVLGVVIVELFKEAVDRLPEKKAEAARFLWKMDNITGHAKDREIEAMVILGLTEMSWETWRRPDDPSPKLDFCRVVAKAFYEYLEAEAQAA